MRRRKKDLSNARAKRGDWDFNRGRPKTWKLIPSVVKASNPSSQLASKQRTSQPTNREDTLVKWWREEEGEGENWLFHQQYSIHFASDAGFGSD